MIERFLILACLAILAPAAIAQVSKPPASPAGAAPMPAAPAAESPAAPSAVAPADAAPANASTKTPAKPAAGRAPTPVNAAAPATAAKGGRSNDRIDLDASQITGNRELPKVLYIVPWKRPDLGDLLGKPVNSLLDEVLAPVDRDVFKRENRYFEALQPGKAAATPATPDSGPSPPPAAKP